MHSFQIVILFKLYYWWIHLKTHLTFQVQCHSSCIWPNGKRQNLHNGHGFRALWSSFIQYAFKWGRTNWNHSPSSSSIIQGKFKNALRKFFQSLYKNSKQNLNNPTWIMLTIFISQGIATRQEQAKEVGAPPPEFKVTAQFLELYNEDIIDLFDQSTSSHNKMTNSSIHVGGVGKRSSSATTGGIRIHEDVNGNIYTVNIFWNFRNNVAWLELSSVSFSNLFFINCLKHYYLTLLS